MCEIYANTDPRDYAFIARSVRLHGMVTSIRLERRFWDILAEMAAAEGVSVPKFLNVLHSEVMERQGEAQNFASFLRVICATHLTLRGSTAKAPIPADA